MLFDGRSFGAFLFDMDGTVLNSIAVAERVWTAWAERWGVDAVSLLATVHGRKAIETISRLGLSGIDPTEEVRLLTQAEIDDVAGVQAISGATDFLKSLPRDRWAIVTSAIDECLVFEDAPAGIEAAEVSGAAVLVVSATHRVPLSTRHLSIENYDHLALDISSTGALRLSGKPL